jgi:hypothetical protein
MIIVMLSQWRKSSSKDDRFIFSLFIPPAQAVHEEGILVDGNAPDGRAEAAAGLPNAQLADLREGRHRPAQFD